MQAIGWAKTELDLQGLSNQVNRAWGEHGIDDAAKQRLQEAITAAMRALKPAGKKGQK